MSIINKAYLDFNGLAYYDEKLKEYIPITHGYYNNGNFYSDSTLTTLITGEANRLYIDLISNNFYEYKNNTYVLVGSGIKVFTGSLSEWNQLSTAEKKTYDFISNDEPGGDGGQFPANKVSYDNTTSGLTAEDVQDAIDELAAGGGGGGGTGDYPDLTNKPQINGVTLTGNKTEDDLKLGYTSISYADWLELTPQQQETGKWDVTGVPGADGTISIDLMTKLWENPSPTSSFPGQQIVLSTDGYDLIFVLFKSAISSNNILSVITLSGKGALMISSAVDIFSRAFDTSTKTFTDGYRGSTIDNTVCIPYQIYGIKLHHTVEIKTIAPTVSTSASKCMMSDGVTSVEDVLISKQNNFTYIGTVTGGIEFLLPSTWKELLVQVSYTDSNNTRHNINTVHLNETQVVSFTNTSFGNFGTSYFVGEISKSKVKLTAANWSGVNVLSSTVLYFYIR